MSEWDEIVFFVGGEEKCENMVLNQLRKVRLPPKILFLIHSVNLSLTNFFNTVFSNYFYVTIVRLPLTFSVARLDRRAIVAISSRRIIRLWI